MTPLAALTEDVPSPHDLESTTAHPNHAEIRDCVPEACRKRSTLRALTLFIPCAALYVATLTATVLLPYWPLRVLAAIANAGFLSILFVMGHDACHGAFTPSRRLNALLGRLALLPAWHPFAGWEHAHNHIHHTWTNYRRKDYAWAPMTKREYDRLTPFAQWRLRRYRSPLGFGAYYFWEVYVKRTLFPTRSFWGNGKRTTLYFDCALTAAFILLQAAYLLLLARWYAPTLSPIVVLAIGQWLPFVIWNWLIGFLIFLHHTHPRVPWFDDRRQWSFFAGQIQGTVHVIFPWGFNWVIQHIMEHTAHHADPKIPLYELPQAQRSLALAFPDDVVVHAFTMRTLRTSVRVCQLYDFDNHYWLSYAGERTSGRTVVVRPSG